MFFEFESLFGKREDINFTGRQRLFLQKEVLSKIGQMLPSILQKRREELRFVGQSRPRASMHHSQHEDAKQSKVSCISSIGNSGRKQAHITIHR